MVREAPHRVSESDSSGSEDSLPIQVSVTRSSSSSAVVVTEAPVLVPEVILELVVSPPSKRRRVGVLSSCSTSRGDRPADPAPTLRGVPEVRPGSVAEQVRGRRRQPDVPAVPVHGSSRRGSASPVRSSRRGSTSPVRSNRRAERVVTAVSSGVTSSPSPVVSTPRPIILSPVSFRFSIPIFR